ARSGDGRSTPAEGGVRFERRPRGLASVVAAAPSSPRSPSWPRSGRQRAGRRCRSPSGRPRARRRRARRRRARSGEGRFGCTRDSTFIYGSTATGEATLWINGDPVPVQPNGAFLAYLPVPADGVYRLRAVAGGETASLEVRVVVPPPPPVLDPDRATIIEGSV